MNLKARHLWTDFNKVIASFDPSDKLESKNPCRPSNIRIKNGVVLIPNMLIEHDKEFQIFMGVVCAGVAVIAFTILMHFDFMSIDGLSSNNIQLSDYITNGEFFVIVGGGSLLLAKLFGELRYITIEGDQAIVHTKKRGKWPIPVKDLRFHIVQSIAPERRYYLEVELPETSFHSYHRMMIIEVAAQKETLEGMLSVILPLIHGDQKPYTSAPKRKIIPLPAEPKPSRWSRYFNLENHFFIWFTMYKFNQFLFWLIHGHRKFRSNKGVVNR